MEKMAKLFGPASLLPRFTQFRRSMVTDQAEFPPAFSTRDWPVMHVFPRIQTVSAALPLQPKWHAGRDVPHMRQCTEPLCSSLPEFREPSVQSLRKGKLMYTTVTSCIEDIVRSVHEEFGRKAELFKPIVLPMNALDCAEFEGTKVAGVYVFVHDDMGCIKVGKSHSNASKRALQHCGSDNTSSGDGTIQMSKLRHSDKTQMLVFCTSERRFYALGFSVRKLSGEYFEAENPFETERIEGNGMIASQAVLSRAQPPSSRVMLFLNPA
jgi:hypothetical protein